MNRKLTAMNKLLMEENDRLQKQVSQLVYENGYFRQHTQSVRILLFSVQYFSLSIVVNLVSRGNVGKKSLLGIWINVDCNSFHAISQEPTQPIPTFLIFLCLRSISRLNY